MNLAAAGTAGLDGLDSSSVPPVRSHGLRLPAAASLLAHVGIVLSLMAAVDTAEEPAGRGNLRTIDVTIVRSARAASPQAMPAPVMHRARTSVRIAPAKATPMAAQSRSASDLLAERKPFIIRERTPSSGPADQPEAATQPVSQSSSSSPAAAEDGAAMVAPASAAAGGEDMLIVEPRFRAVPTPPAYPKRARELGEQGEALLRVRLDEEGNAAEILVWKSSGFVLLDNAAQAAVRRWQFEPARRDGMPVLAWVQIPVRFSLN